MTARSGDARGAPQTSRGAAADAAADPVAEVLRDAVAVQVGVHPSALASLDRLTLGRIAARLQGRTGAERIRVARAGPERIAD